MARYKPNWAEKMMEPVEFGEYCQAPDYDKIVRQLENALLANSLTLKDLARCKADFAKAQSEVVRHVTRITALTDALRIARGYVDDETKPLHDTDLAMIDAVLDKGFQSDAAPKS
jgi:hypothetical protein